MSTHSTVALPLDNGFMGRYIHGNGYPTWQAVALLALVRRDGLETVRRVLTQEHYGWSRLDPNAKTGDANFLDERGEIVPGYGLAYTDTKLTEHPFGTKRQPFQQVTADEWCRHDNDPDVAYAYVLNDDRLTVLENDGNWRVLGYLPYDATVTAEGVEELLAQSLTTDLAASDKLIRVPMQELTRAPS